jgi:hypothetical protein
LWRRASFEEQWKEGLYHGDYDQTLRLKRQRGIHQRFRIATACFANKQVQTTIVFHRNSSLRIAQRIHPKVSQESAR